MSEATPRARVEARVGPLIPDGWRLGKVEPFDGGWRLSVENIADPLVSVGVWDPNLERATMMLVEELQKKRPPN